MRVTRLFLAIGLATALENGLARTPQLGWVRIETYSSYQSKLEADRCRILGIHLPAA